MRTQRSPLVHDKLNKPVYNYLENQVSESGSTRNTQYLQKWNRPGYSVNGDLHVAVYTVDTWRQGGSVGHPNTSLWRLCATMIHLYGCCQQLQVLDWFTPDECWGYLYIPPFPSSLGINPYARNRHDFTGKRKWLRVKKNKIKQSESARIDMERYIPSMR